MLNILTVEASEFWTHLELVGSLFVPILIFWLDTRKQNRTNHLENVIRLTSIETKVTPLSDHWNRKGPW